MTESTKDSSDDVPTLPSPPLGSNTTSSSSFSTTLAPPPPYSIDADQDAHHTEERRHPYFADPEVAISHPPTLTYISRLPSKRNLRTLAIFMICLLALAFYTHSKRQMYKLTLDGLAWADITPSQRCLRFGTREYSAQLMGVPKGEDGLRYCKEKSIVIHGFKIEKPEYCTTDVGNSAPTNLRVLGHWTVDFNEASCKTLWENFQDKGCVAIGSKTRRIEAHMGNHQPPWDNWREMCSTTPANYDGHHFDQPSSCDHRGIFSGIWGVWFVKDENC